MSSDDERDEHKEKRDDSSEEEESGEESDDGLLDDDADMKAVRKQLDKQYARRIAEFRGRGKRTGKEPRTFKPKITKAKKAEKAKRAKSKLTRLTTDPEPEEKQTSVRTVILKLGMHKPGAQDGSVVGVVTDPETTVYIACKTDAAAAHARGGLLITPSVVKRKAAEVKFQGAAAATNVLHLYKCAGLLETQCGSCHEGTTACSGSRPSPNLSP